jgi:hypothetical protein
MLVYLLLVERNLCIQLLSSFNVRSSISFTESKIMEK